MPIDFLNHSSVVLGYARVFCDSGYLQFSKYCLLRACSGYNVAIIFRDNIALLDQYIRDDFAVTENYLILDKKIVDIQPTVQETGTVASVASIIEYRPPAKIPQVKKLDTLADNIIVPAGQLDFRLEFPESFLKKPVVTATVNEKIDDGYWISKQDAFGFTLFLEKPQPEDVLFSWNAVALPE